MTGPEMFLNFHIKWDWSLQRGPYETWHVNNKRYFSSTNIIHPTWRDTAAQNFKFLYALDQPIEAKIETIAREIYGAADIAVEPAAREKIERYTKQGFAGWVRAGWILLGFMITHSLGFSDAWFWFSVGLVGRTTAAVQPRQVRSVCMVAPHVVDLAFVDFFTSRVPPCC